MTYKEKIKLEIMKIKKVEEIMKTTWLSLKHATYLDKNENEQHWDYISRNDNRQIVTVVCRSRRYNKFLFISQPRVPINNIEISFPSGLIDKGESPGQAALRELKEETGYVGEVLSVSTLCPKSAGLSNESNFIVECKVNEQAIQQSEMEETEDIQSFWKTPTQLMKFIREMNSKEISVSSNVYNFVLGHEYSKKMKSRTK
jgi:hypothetical protein